MGGLSYERFPVAPLPLTGKETVIVDTGTNGGASGTQTAKISLTQLATSGVGDLFPTAYASSMVLDLSKSSYQSIILNGNANLSFSNPSSGQEFFLQVKQDVIGSRVITFDSSVTMPSASVPVLSTAPNAIDLFKFVYDASNQKYRLVLFTKGMA